MCCLSQKTQAIYLLTQLSSEQQALETATDALVLLEYQAILD